MFYARKSDLGKKKLQQKKLQMMALTILLICSLCAFISAQQIQKDVSVNIILPSIVNASNYTRFIRITNNNDVEGENDNLSVFVKMELIKNNDLNEPDEITKWNVTKSLNFYSESGFGTVILERSGSYTLCAEITALNFIDMNIENNADCEDISVLQNESNVDVNINTTTNITTNITNNTAVNSTINDTNITGPNLNETDEINTTNETNKAADCGCALEIRTEKDLFHDGEKIEFIISDCANSTKFEHPIEYWIEDSTGTVKPLLNTTSKSAKSYTPSIDAQEKYFLIKSKLQECENVSEKLVVAAKEATPVQTFIKITSPEEISVDSKNEIIYAEIDGYKADSSKTLISVWAEGGEAKISETTKIYINEKNSYFSFKVPVILDVKESGNYALIAEGLGEKEESKIKIIYDGEEQITESRNNNEEKIIKTGAKITSFYTRKKTFELNITFYISVDEPEGKRLVITGENQTLTIRNVSKTNTINFTINSESELITAELYSESFLLDYAELKLNLTRTTEKNTSEKTVETEQDVQTINVETRIKQMKNISESNFSESYGAEQNKITGQITAIKPGRRGAVFMLAAIIICFTLFNRKVRTSLIFLFRKAVKKQNR